ncbi:Dehydrogenase citC [Drechslerella dactyloides]|uniref:Dehydrogenase citC n=1 Tax=Drechslerella dactyloides TaxID=74499 RepID=A0AAD6J2S4_DREDA|nr:Dehydrogenase citC [Drechslerella dactyloides]
MSRIAGGGTAGLTIAARLTENPAVTVAVIEAGENRVDDLTILAPGLLTALYSNPDYDWNFHTVPQAGVNDKIYAHARGKVLGGSSAINFLFWTHPSRKDIDNWGRLGNEGWSWNALKSYFKKSEQYVAPSSQVQSDLRTQYIIPSSHGTSGPIRTVFPDWYTELTEAWPRTFAKLGLAVNSDPADGLALGGYTNLINLDLSSHTRSYAATGYYAPNAGRPNLHVFTGSLVKKVVLTKRHGAVVATGVEFIKDGVATTIHATKEVIVSAGSFGSPQILELSGIGKSSLLRKHGIPVLVDNPNVGENLQDHVYVPIGLEVNDGIFTLDSFRDEAVFNAALQEYLTKQTGPISVSGASSALLSLRQIAGSSYNLPRGKFAPSPNPALAVQHALQIEDLFTEAVAQELTIGAGINPVWQNDTSKLFNSGLPTGNFLSILGVLEHPFSRGSVHITSADPAAYPAIDPNYLSHPLDIEILSKIVLHLQTVARTAPLCNLLKNGGKKYQPGYHELTLGNVKAWIKSALQSEFHPLGTCSMLPKAKGGVVDAKFRVHGVQGLRVVDASVFPLMVRANIQSLVYAVAERAADFIKESNGLHANVNLENIILHYTQPCTCHLLEFAKERDQQTNVVSLSASRMSSHRRMASVVISIICVWELAKAEVIRSDDSAVTIDYKNRNCGELLQHNRTLYNEVQYKGHLTNYHGSPEADVQLVAITYDGCVRVCGNFWRNDSQTTLDLLLDWILPALGLITNMPWDSNRNSVTVVWLARWIGSPIAALAFCLWDVRIASKCAKLINLITRHRDQIYHSEVIRQQSDAEDERETFSDARDTSYILLVMNQFQLKKSAEQDLTSEELVMAVERALFSREVVNGLDLVEERRSIASELRDRRKRGEVPILLGLGGFFFAMAVAIKKAFDVGDNERATAFNVGLGLLVGWLPVLYLAAVVDSDHDNKPDFALRFNKLVSACHSNGDFIDIFGDGKGQGRGRWHYGIGQTIMSRIEDEFVVGWKNGTPFDLDAMRRNAAPPTRRIEFGHWRIIEPILSGFVIVSGISSGAFILAYFTPPVGLAWRSAAYLTCLCIAVLIFLIDLALFKIVRHPFMTANDQVKHGVVYNFCKSVRFRQVAHLVLITLEIINTLTLCLLVIAMSAGLFNFCAGQAVNRSGPGGGLIILNDGAFYSKYFDIINYYILGIVPQMILMSVATLYLIEQWFTQSFMSADSVEAGVIGWKRSRRWKWITTLGGAMEVGETLRWIM